MQNLHRVVGLTLALTCAAATTACGGGGGGGNLPGVLPNGSPTPQPNQSVTVPGAPTNPTAGTAPTTRAVAQSGLAASQYASIATGSSGASALAVERSTQAARRAVAGRRLANTTCSAGFTETTTTNGAATHVVDTQYYDAACTLKKSVSITDVTVAAGGNSATANGTTTLYDRSGNVTSYVTLALSLNQTGTMQQLQISGTQAASVGGPIVASIGLMCTVPNGSTTSVSCSTAAVQNGASAATGVELTYSATTATSGATTTANLSLTAVLYLGNPGALTVTSGRFGGGFQIGGSIPAFNMSGSGTATGGAGGLTALNVSFTASTGDAVTAIGSAAGTTVTCTKNGATVATATTDPTGNGAVTYANGTTEKIVGFAIVGT